MVPNYCKLNGTLSLPTPHTSVYTPRIQDADLPPSISKLLSSNLFVQFPWKLIFTFFSLLLLKHWVNGQALCDVGLVLFHACHGGRQLCLLVTVTSVWVLLLSFREHPSPFRMSQGNLS